MYFVFIDAEFVKVEFVSRLAGVILMLEKHWDNILDFSSVIGDKNIKSL